jgi:hypothetical protein
MTHLGRFSSNIRFWFITFLYVVWLAPETWIVAKATATQQCSKQVSVRCLVLPTTASLYSWFESRATKQEKRHPYLGVFSLAPETG